MAEAGEKTLDKLERELTCPCAMRHGHYHRAKLLPCNHYYCEACIEELAKQSQGELFRCPECPKETSLPAGGAAELPSAFFVEGMKVKYGRMAVAEGKIKPKCEQCEGGRKALAFCRRCAHFICPECVRRHKRTNARHEVANLKDMTKAEIMNTPLKESPPVKCSKHDKEMDTFCCDCDQLICRDCTVVDHKDHNHDSLKNCATKTQKLLRDSLKSLERVKADVGGGIADAEKVISFEVTKIDNQRDEVCKVIKESIEKLEVLLHQKQEELQMKADTLAEQKKKALLDQRKKFSLAQTEIQQLVKVILQDIWYTSDCDLMSIQKQLLTKMEEGEKRLQQLQLEPDAKADLNFSLSCPHAISGFVFDQSLSPRFLNSNIPCAVGSLMDVSVLAPAATLSDISAEMESVSSNPLKADIVQKCVGIYSITFTPRVRGYHDLTVRIKNEVITGRPFVTIPPSKLGQNIRTVGGFDRPWG